MRLARRLAKRKVDRALTKQVFGKGDSRLGQERGSGRRHLLHPGGEVGRLAHGGVVHAQGRADGSHDDLAGIDA